MSIITKKGDFGKTKNFAGKTISKNSTEISAIGTLDELMCSIGIAKAEIKNKKLKSDLENLQKKLLIIGTTISSNNKKYIQSLDIKEIENKIYNLENKIKLPKKFILPGKNIISANLDMARSIARKLERDIVFLKQKKININKNLLIYLNRISDYLFMLARKTEKY